MYSVVIPVFDDKRVLKTIACFKNALDNQENECLVVCNRTENELLNDIRNSAKNSPNIKVIFVTKRGTPLARNIGIVASQKKYVFFIDDDCTFDKDFFLKVKAAHKGEDVVRGKINFLMSNQESNVYAWLRAFWYDTYKDNFYTPNLIINRRVFDKVGLYNEELQGGEDTEWSQRLQEHKDISKKYTDLFVLTHVFDNPKKINKTLFSYGKCQAYRIKKSLLVYKTPPAQIIKRIFSDASLVSAHQSWDKNLFVIKYLFLKIVGIIYGLIFTWRHLNKEAILAKDAYFKSKNYQNSIKQYTKK